MAMVPYKPRNFYSQSTAMVPYVPRPVVRQRKFLPTTRGISKRRRGSKFGIINNTTNPVYPRPEVKFFDFNIGTLAVPVSIVNTGTFSCANQVLAGSGISQRIGNTVATKSIYYQFVLNFGTATAPIALRHMLIWDRQPNGALPANLGAILSSAAASPIVAPMSLAYRDRYVVLADDRLTLSPQGDNIRIINGFRSINQKTVYDDTTPFTIPSSGSLVVVFASDETSTNPTMQPTIYGTWRTRYIDN